MPIQNTNRNTTWMLDQSNQTWTLTKNATIRVNNAEGIYEAGQSGNEIKVLGDIVVKGFNAGVRFGGSDSSVLIGQDSRIIGNQTNYAIHSEGAGSDIINRGLIQAGGGHGIHGNIWNDVENYGTIRGEIGMSFNGSGSQIYNYGLIDAHDTAISSLASGTHVENAKGAVIRSDDVGIRFYNPGMSELVNKGLLRSENVAIADAEGQIDITNSGTIIGKVYMGGSADSFDSRKGELKGTVFGGDGDDDYFVGQTSMKISEGDGVDSGYDQVASKVTYKLSANIEELTLTGTRDINATGNGGDNNIHGNNGDNKLSGLGGNDFLSAQGGNDILRGGAGFDTFAFNLTNGGVDRVTDFVDGEDLVSIASIDTQQEFDALDIKQVNGDLVINMGSGDKIIIEDLLKSDFTYNDIYV